MGPCFWWGPASFLPAIMAIIMLVGLAFCLYLIFGGRGFCCPFQGWGRHYDHENSSAPVQEIRRTCCTKAEVTKE